MFAGLFVLGFIAIDLLAIVASIVLLVLYFVMHRRKAFLYAIFAIWVPQILFALIVGIIIWINQPRPLTTDVLIGNYVIDTTFFRGKNAEWQKHTFRLCLSKDSLILYEKLADGSEKQFRGKVSWESGPPAKWSVSMIDAHHVVDPHPTLYRTTNGHKFYYVFKSKKFGNMFFRKESD